MPKPQLAYVDTLGFCSFGPTSPSTVSIDGNVPHESKEQKRIQLVGWLLASGGRGRHRLPRIAGELSSVIAGTSPTASFSKSKPIGVSRARFISWFFEYT